MMDSYVEKIIELIVAPWLRISQRILDYIRFCLRSRYGRAYIYSL